VIAVASGKNKAFPRDLGADEFIDYEKTSPEDTVRDVDLVINAVGGRPLAVSCARSSVMVLCFQFSR
jgi:NADPH:quinone reductase-like Zn-dependent oxidoreductase